MFTFPRRRVGAIAAAAGIAVAAAVGAGTVAPAAHADQVVASRWVKGQIEITYFALSGPQGLGVPVTDELPDRRGGRFQRFAGASSIYWHPWVDGGNAHQVGGAIRDAWAAKNWEVGPLGYPVSDERRITESAGFPGLPIPLAFGQQVTGAWEDFQGGSVYWRPQYGARIVWGEIAKKFLTAGGVAKYGWPISDEIASAGRWTQKFEKGELSWP